MTYSAPLINEIAGLLDKCGDNGRTMPATTLYNETWLLRVALDWHSQNRNKCPDSPFSFHSRATCFSEGLLASHFIKGPKREKHTHADGVIGNIYTEKTAEIWPKKDAKQLIVVEEKLGSLLSPGTEKTATITKRQEMFAALCTLSAKPSETRETGLVCL